MVRGLLLALLCWTSTVAAAPKVDHLSVNRVHSGPGEPLALTMNVVGDPFVVEQLRFFLVQQGRQLPLARQMEGDFLIHLRSEVPAREARIQLAVTRLFQDQPDKQIHFNIDLKPGRGSKPQASRQAATAAEVNPQPAQLSPSPPKLCPLNGRTLWSMARETAPSLGVGHYGALVALVQANPKCFPGGDPNRLICKELRCPGSQALRQWQDESSAKVRFKALMKAAAN
ncbi:hypothetical protein FCL40_01105 [Ferrimonas sediminicola]|uniref:Pilus assembly protein FimV n=1 Tax=Ferrimonas sediminicola TaxID=2569538 RepID=A0A4U1BK48_9GAMM|nr:hypothetical protein [Ferrimonas sediminicola]TKB51184.1 hypothetical protein FCL40_01105 [Ferrimonas sediminicola]